MKNALFLSFSILILGNLGHFGLPWWSLVPVAALAGWLFPLSSGKNFAFAFAAGLLLWLANAFFLNSANDGLLSAKVGVLFQGLKGGHLLLLTGIFGGILAAFGAMTGRLARVAFVGEQAKR